MNKWTFFSLFVCVIGLSNAIPTDQNSTSSSSSEENFAQFAEKIKSKFNITLLADIQKMAQKAQETCPDIEKKVESTLDEVRNCVEEIELGSDTFCSLIKKNFAKCAKPAKDLITGCLPDESKELPAMIEKIIVSVIDQVCSSTVEEILELFNPCALEKDPESFTVCKEIKTVFDEHKNKLPSKSLICETLPKVRNCGKAILEASCQNQVTRNSVAKFHNAIENAVKDECDALNKA